MTDFPLDRKDRLILANQYRLLEQVHPAEAESYGHAIEILQNGYELEYESLASWTTTDTLTIDQCREVHAILTMYRWLHHSYAELEDKSGIDVAHLGFFGFDGNNEGKYLSYARFLSSQGGTRNHRS